MYISFRHFFLRHPLAWVLLLSGLISLSLSGCKEQRGLVSVIGHSSMPSAPASIRQSDIAWADKVYQYQSSFDYLQKLDRNISSVVASLSVRFGLEDTIIFSSNASCLLPISYQLTPPDVLYPWLEETADCGQALMKQLQSVAYHCADQGCQSGDKSALVLLHKDAMLLLDEYLGMIAPANQRLFEEKIFLQEAELAFAQANSFKIEYYMIRLSQSVEEMAMLLGNSVSEVGGKSPSLNSLLSNAEEDLSNFVNFSRKREQVNKENLDKDSLTVLYKASRKLLDTFAVFQKEGVGAWDILAADYESFCIAFNQTFFENK